MTRRRVNERATIAFLLVTPSRGRGGGGERPASVSAAYPRGEAEPPQPRAKCALASCESGSASHGSAGRRRGGAAPQPAPSRGPGRGPQFPRGNAGGAQRGPPFVAVGGVWKCDCTRFVARVTV